MALPRRSAAAFLKAIVLARALTAPAIEAAVPPAKPTMLCTTEVTAATARMTAALAGASFLAVALNAAVSLKPTFDLQRVQAGLVNHACPSPPAPA